MFRQGLDRWKTSRRHNFVGDFGTDGNEKIGLEEAVIISLCPALEPQAFRDELQERVRWALTDEGLDEMVRAIDNVKGRHVSTKQGTPREKAAAGRNWRLRENNHQLRLAMGSYRQYHRLHRRT